MSSPSFRFLCVGVLLSPFLLAGLPIEVSAQYSVWSGQADVFAGWYSPHGKRDWVMGSAEMGGRAELSSSSLFGGRLFFPVSDTHRRNLGKVSLGLRGLIVPGAQLKPTDGSDGIGTADYYELLGTISTGDFLPTGGGLNLRLNGMLGVGVGHTAYELDPGVGWSRGGRSATVPVLSLGVGGDIPLFPSLSLVTSASWTWSLTKPDQGSVTEKSFALVGGFALRWPFGGGSG